MFLIKHYLFFLGVILTPTIYPVDNFVISNEQPKKKYSTTQLKEHIGQETKDLFNQTTTVGITLAKIHEQVAQLQKTTLTSKKDSTKLLKHTTTVHELCGKLNKELAFVQQHCSSLIESLVDDCPPFKKAHKNDLSEALTSLEDARKTIGQSINLCQSWCQDVKHLPADHCTVEKKMCTLCKNLDSCVNALTCARTTMNGKKCLKVA